MLSPQAKVLFVRLNGETRSVRLDGEPLEIAFERKSAKP
jgi:hypothetical protein